MHYFRFWGPVSFLSLHLFCSILMSIHLCITYFATHAFSKPNWIKTSCKYPCKLNSLQPDKRTYRCLQLLATDPHRLNVPSFAFFVDYYNGNEDYDDTLLSDAFLKESSGNNLSFEKLSDQHRGDIIETSLQTVVIL